MEQNEILILVLIGVALIAAIAIWLSFRNRRTHALREKYGDEYDRTLAEEGKRSAAEASLRDREKRVRTLDIRPLAPAERQAFGDEWREVKAVFVDSPAEAVLHADRLVAKMLATRGFPMADFDHRYEDLTVDHGHVARHYRAGHQIAQRQGRGQAGTEDLRQALKHYEVLVDDMLNDVSDTVESRPVTSAAQRA